LPEYLLNSDIDQKLALAVAERDRLSAEVQRIEGRKEAAEAALEQVRAEIKAKNLDPDTLDTTISDLQQAYETEVLSFETQVQDAAQALSPFLKDKQ